MTPSRRLLARLLPLLVPIASCGGAAPSDTGATGTSATGGASASAGGAQGGGAQAGTTAAGVGGSSAAGAGPAFCTENAPFLPDVDTGFVLCVGFSVHRPAIGTCPDRLPITTGACAPSGGPNGCVDSMCTASPHGYCAANATSGTVICACQYGCITDAECANGRICLCGPTIGTCVDAGCTKDAECGDGSVCLSYTTPAGCSTTIAGFACTTPQDACQSDADCPHGAAGSGASACGHDGSKRVCFSGGPGMCLGRLLFVADTVRVAALRSDAAWGVTPSNA